MLKALKVTMIIWGIWGIILGLAFLFVPRELGEMFGRATEEVPVFVLSSLATLGICMIAPSIFIIVAARDPLKHIWWVKFAILWTALGLVADIYSAIRGYVTFSGEMTGIILQAVFLAALLIFYPWRGAREA
jgi:hypothetical protein